MAKQNTGVSSKIAELLPSVSGFQRFTRIFLNRKVVVFGFIVLVLVMIAAVFADWIAPYDPNLTDLTATYNGPSWEHPFGTDGSGRDTLSRVIFGSRASLMVGVGAIAIAVLVGMSLGLIAGYFGGWTFTIIMRLMDAMMAFPPIMLSLAMAVVLGSGLQNLILILGILMIPAYCRMMCGQVLSVREHDYVLAGRAIGAHNWRIMFRHIAPNCFPPILVQMTMMLGHVILIEAGLSFLGYGVQPPTAAWGSMVAEGSKRLIETPELSFAPGLAIMLTVFALNMVGDGLRDALDPRLRGRI